MLWSLVLTNWGSFWPQIASLWLLRCCGFWTQWTVAAPVSKLFDFSNIVITGQKQLWCRIFSSAAAAAAAAAAPTAAVRVLLLLLLQLLLWLQAWDLEPLAIGAFQDAPVAMPIVFISMGFTVLQPPPLGTEKMPKYLVLKGKNFFPAPSAPENTPIYPYFHFLLHI